MASRALINGWPLAPGRSGAAAVTPPTLQPIVALGNIIAPSGDSTATTTGPYSSTQNALRSDQGGIVWARQLLKGKVDFNRALNFGRGGITTGVFISDYLTNLVNALNAKQAHAAVISLGINDTFTSNNVPTETAKANVDTIMAALTATGCPQIWRDLWPTTDAATDQTKQAALRDYIRSKADPTKGIYITPSWNAVATVANGTVPKTGALKDGVHYATLGAQSIGRAEAAVLDPLFPAVDLFAQSWINTNTMTGTTGTVSGTGATGTAPTGFTVAAGTTTGGTLVVSIVTENGVNKLRLVGTDYINETTPGTTSVGMNVYGPSTANAGFTAGTDFVDSIVRVEVAANPGNGLLTGLGQIAAGNRTNGGTFLPTGTTAGVAATGGNAMDASYAGSSSADTFDGLPFDVVLRPPAFVYPQYTSGTTAPTQLYVMWLMINTIKGIAGNFDIKISQPRNRIKTTLLQ